MKTPTYVKNALIVLLILFGTQLFAQSFVPFSSATRPPRFDQDIRGDMILIGNNILGPGNGNFNDNSASNDDENMRYIDVDSDPTTFSSSIAELAINSPSGCYQIVYAGLYWSAVDNGQAPIDRVKFRGPTGGYVDINATEVIFDAGSSSVDGGHSFPYACYADVTNIVRALGTNQGNYTVANVSSRQGRTSVSRNYTGNSAGWSLFIVYEDPTLTGKSITSFDGFSAISALNNQNDNITISGFRTIPSGPVRAKFAFAALEGDKTLSGDRLRINGTRLESTGRGRNNFFNSTISGPPSREPQSTNTLGFDTGIVDVPNPSNSVIDNNDTSAVIRLETDQDTYFPYFFAFAVDIIAPEIVLTKVVEDAVGNDISNQLVGLGDELNYVIGFQNIGNDDARDFTIRDVLPNNIIFNYPADMGLLPSGITVQSYNAATRELIFEIDSLLVQENDPVYEIRFRAEVVRECSLLNNACDNIVSNQAFSTYRGVVNNVFTTDDPSFSSNTGCLLVPAATNFIADINCTFEDDVILCGSEVELTAGGGYDTYSWSTSPSGTPVIGRDQVLRVTTPGTYYVRNTATAPCQSIDQIFNVITYGAGVPNPVEPFADEIVICPNGGYRLPNIYMCGASDTRLIDTNITDADTIVWQRLDEASCTAVTNINCPNIDSGCTWNTVNTGPDFLVDTAGQYRVRLNYDGGCFNLYYFNVYENVLLPTADVTDIICTTPGEITVNDVPSGYEYSIDGVNFQPSNVIPITAPDIYTVYIRQIGVTPNPCIFTVPDLQVRQRDFEVTTNITQPLCHDEQGSVLVAANDVRPQYYYSIYDGATLINSVGPINESDYTFPNLTAGRTYTINVSTDDGCTYSGTIDIVNPPELDATMALTSPLSCTDGEITVYPRGGTPPYAFFVNSSTVFQITPDITVTTPGTYNVRVVDGNNCFVDLSLDVDAILPPDFTVAKTDILCSGSGNQGEININVTNANGNTLRYSIDNGATFSNSPVFTGLSAGTYQVVVEYSAEPTDICLTTAQSIEILQLSAINGTAALTTPYTCTTDGVITVSGVSGGTAPYSFSIDGVTFQPGNTFTGLTDGTYTVTIRDDSGCTVALAPIDIDALNPPTDLTFTYGGFDCDDETSSFNVNLPSWGGGLPPIRFQIVALPPSIIPGSPLYNYLTQVNADGQYSGVPAGVYTFEVTDRNGCTYREDYSLSPEPPIAVAGTVLGNVNCFSSATGSIEFNVIGTFTGGNDVYDYNVTGPVNFSDTRQTAPTIPLNNLPAGTYTITVTERGTGCTDTTTVTVEGPPTELQVTTNTSPITCLVGGSVTINATGGWGGYSYSLTQPDATVLGPQGSNSFTGLSQTGTYTASVTDSNGCAVTDTFTLSTPTGPSATIDATSDLCFDSVDDATLIVNATGGQTPYEFSINGGPFGPGNTFANLTPNTYTIVVRDAYGCTFTLPAQTIAPQLTLSAALTKDIDCTATPDALITGTIVGGTAPYTYEVSLNGGGYLPGGPVIANPFTYLTATPGDYRFRITDNTGCQTESGVVTVNAAGNPTAAVNQLNPTCNGLTNGSVEIIPSDGSGGYTFSFNGSAFTTQSSYPNLGAGTYTFIVRDSNECTFNGSVTLTEPDALVAAAAVAPPLSCSPTNVNQPATVTVTATPGTGTAPYQFSFNGSGYSGTNTLSVNDNGSDQTINYSVRDAQGCIVNGSVVVTALNPPTPGTITGTDVTCNTTTSTVTVTPAAGSGVGTLTYEITAPAASVTTNATGIFPGLAPSVNYTFRVTDANGCYYEVTYFVDPVENIGVIGNIVNNVSCFGGNDGAVTFSVSGFSGTYSYTINGGAAITGQSATTIPLTGLSAGNQVIEVTDETTGCTATTTVPVSEPATALSLSATASNVFCSNDESQITVTALNGTPGYRFAAVVSGNPAPAVGAYGSSNIITVDTNSGADLVWDVYVRDANDCVESTTVTIVNDPVPTVTTPPLASNQCAVTTGWTFTVTGSGGVAPLEFSIDGGISYQLSNIFTVNTPGTYTVTVRDANGCTATSTTDTEVFASVTAGAIITKDITCSIPTEATIDVTISGGNAPYTYAVSVGGGAFTGSTSVVGTTFTYSTNVANDHQFRITDANGCTVDTNEVTTNAAVPVTTSNTFTDPTCNGDTDGTITLNATAGAPPFTYSIDGGATTSGTNVFGGLSAGTYNYVVRDSKGCEETGTIPLNNPDPIVPNIDINGITCTGGTPSPGSFEVSVTSGGTAPYEYTLLDNSFNVIATYSEASAAVTPVYTFGGLNFGDYYINIVDANGCEFNSARLRINTPPDLQVNGFVDTSSCATGVDYTVETTGGIPNYTYSVLGGTVPPSGSIASTTYTFTGLRHNVTYFFQVTDANGCISVFEATMPPPPSSIEIAATTETDVNCSGDSDGTLAFTVQNYDATVTDIDYVVLDALTLLPLGTPINGTLSGPAGGPVSTTISTLPAGNYILQVTEATGTQCSNTFTFEITQPAQPLTAAVIANANANCNSGALVTVNATGGTGPYTYEAGPAGFTAGTGEVAPSNNNVLTLDPAIRTTWEILVIDTNGCPFRLSESINTDPLPTIDPVAQQCFDGTPINITLVEGTGSAITPVRFGLDGVYQTSPNFTIGSAGTYTLSVQDGNNCVASISYVVEPPLLLDADLTQDLTCAVDGNIVLTPTGGSGGYTFEVSFNGSAFAGIAGSPYTATADGDYVFRVTDSQGCQAVSGVIPVTPRTTPVASELHTDVTCLGDTDGTITVTASNGIPPYEYSINNGATFQTSNTFGSLAPGAYNVVVRDDKDCVSAAVPVNIAEPDVVVANPTLTQGLTCGVGNATQEAVITVSAIGGSGNYFFSFDGGVNFTSNNTFTTTTAGPVTIVVRDDNGCPSAPVVQDVPALDPPTDLVFVSTPVTCIATTSTVTLTPTDGVGTPSFAILSPASETTNVTGAASGIFTGLTPGIYVFEVTDANGCTYEEAYEVEDVDNITVSGILVNDVSCISGADGAVEFTVGNFAGTYSYSINGAAAVTNQSALSIPLAGLSAGPQVIVVTDETTGCTATATVDVNEPSSAVTLTETINTNANCNFNAQVTVEANGGTPGYRFAFVEDGVAPVPSDYTGSASAVLDPAVNTDWDVYVLDANGCPDQIDVTIATDPLPMVSVPTIAANQCNLTGDPFTFTVTGTGVGTLEYSIGSGFQTSTTFTVTAPGTYSVTVRDRNNCEFTSPTTITIYEPLGITPTITALPSCSNDDGVITVDTTGGTGGYSLAISPSAPSISLSTNVYSGVPAGTYTITVTDNITTCTNDVTVVIDAATPVTFTLDPDDVSCNGGNDGQITVDLPASNDNPVYTFEIIAGPITRGPQNSNIFPDLVAGAYTVQVTSGRGCVNTESTTVGEPALLTVSGTATPYDCAPDNTVNTSILTITEGGGTGPYAYSINGTDYFPTNTFEIADTGSPQVINIFVRDANACIETNTVNIAPLPTMTAASVVIATPIDCNGTGSVDINVIGGSGNFEFQMLPSGTPQASNNFSITAPGVYHFRVIDLTTNCTIDTPPFEVLPFDTIDAELRPTSVVTCFSDTDGAFEINITGYTGPYTYDILDSNGASVRGITAANTSTNPEPVTGLTGGNYTVVVTETNSPFCTTTSNVVTIDSPPAPLTLSATETASVTCDNNAGVITAIASDGRPGYEYELTGAATVPYSINGTFSNLSAGSYVVNVRDAGGCIESMAVTLRVPDPIDATVTPSTTLLDCFDDTNASITVSAVTGGQGSNYTYTLNTISPVASSSGPQVSPVFTGLGAGVYTVTVTDGYNCEFTSPNVIINEPTEIDVTLSTASTATCSNSATLTLSATGGTGSYTYSDTPSFVTTLGSFTASVTFPATPGTHAYYVRDANGCNSNISNEVVVEPVIPLMANPVSTNVAINCTGDTTGTITITAVGGLGNYIYTLQDTSGTNITPVTQDSPGVFTNLPAGQYQVRVDSGDCLTTSPVITITEPANPLEATLDTSPVSCPGSDDGVLEISASGGTGLIRYAISPRLDQFFETPRFENLAAGTYQVVIQDELGCFIFDDFTIEAPVSVILTVDTASLIPEVCSGDMDGEFSVDITGGVLPYSVAIDDVDGPYTTGGATQTRFDFTGLSGGDHEVYVRDALGCESVWPIDFPDSVTLNPEVAVEYGCTANISTNTVTVTIDASITDMAEVDYALNGGAYQPSNVFVDVPAGVDHVINVRHTNGCIQQTETFDIDQIEPLAIAIDDGELNEIVATTTGGVGPYEYTLNGESYGSESTFIIYASGDYTVTVTDRNGCVASATRYFEYIDVCISNYFTPNGDGDLDEWGPGCTSQYDELTLDIFDRYGRAIATLRVGEKWDGKYNGVELPTGDYWYVVKLNDPKDDREFVGHFTLYR